MPKIAKPAVALAKDINVIDDHTTGGINSAVHKQFMAMHYTLPLPRRTATTTWMIANNVENRLNVEKLIAKAVASYLNLSSRRRRRRGEPAENEDDDFDPLGSPDFLLLYPTKTATPNMVYMSANSMSSDAYSITLSVSYTGDKSVLQKLVSDIRKLLPPIHFKEDLTTYFSLVNVGPTGISIKSRALHKQYETFYGSNYDGVTRKLMEDLTNYKPDGGGKIILLSGVPGSGKTHLIMNLMKIWKKWAHFSYVVDPISLFGGSSQYLTTMLLDDRGSDNWNVFVMEDVGELLGKDAKFSAGQGIGQLLNAADDILGQGLNNLFILTTNEEVGKLNEAIIRKGRCLIRHEINYLSVEEGNVWLKEHNSTKTVDKKVTLAELYAMTKPAFKTNKKRDANKPVGFMAKLEDDDE